MTIVLVVLIGIPALLLMMWLLEEMLPRACKAIARSIRLSRKRRQAKRRGKDFAKNKTVSLPCSLRRVSVSPRWMRGRLELGEAGATWYHALDQTQPIRFAPATTVCLSCRWVELPELEHTEGDTAFLIERGTKQVEIAVRTDDAELVRATLQRFHTSRSGGMAPLRAA
jgi:hypothetical protein